MKSLLPTFWIGVDLSLARFIDYIPKAESRIVNFHITLVYQHIIGGKRNVQYNNEEFGFAAMDSETVEIRLSTRF